MPTLKSPAAGTDALSRVSSYVKTSELEVTVAVLSVGATASETVIVKAGVVSAA